MSKILKFIVNLVILLSIVIAAALLVPSFLGIDTVINDNLNIETNLPVGAVAYGKQMNTKELKKKDKIIYVEGSEQYVYEIQDMDTTASVYKVKDVYNKNSDTESVTLEDTVSKAIITVPFIGYAAIALQSKTGLIVMGAIVVFLILLFILSEVLRRGEDEYDDEEEDEEDEEDDEEEIGYWERRRLKKEEKRRQEEYDEEEDNQEDDEEDEEEEIGYWERRRLKKEEKRRRKEMESEDDEEEEQDEIQETVVSETVSSENPQELQGFDEAMKDVMSSMAAEVTQVCEPESVSDETVVMPNMEKIDETTQELEVPEEPLEADTEQKAEVSEAEEDIAEDNIIIEEMQTEIFEETETPVDINIVPKTPSVEELLAKAAESGEQPKVKKDEENEITFLDYSDLL